MASKKEEKRTFIINRTKLEVKFVLNLSISNVQEEKKNLINNFNIQCIYFLV